MQADRQRDRQSERQTDRRAGRRAGRQAARQADTHRHRHIHTHRHTHRHMLRLTLQVTLLCCGTRQVHSVQHRNAGSKGRAATPVRVHTKRVHAPHRVHWCRHCWQEGRGCWPQRHCRTPNCPAPPPQERNRRDLPQVDPEPCCESYSPPPSCIPSPCVCVRVSVCVCVCLCVCVCPRTRNSFLSLSLSPLHWSPLPVPVVPVPTLGT